MESQAVKQPAAGSLTRWLNGPFDSSISAKHRDWRSEVCDVDVAENTTMYLFFSVFTFCEAETTANIDVFELAVAKSTTIYNIFQCVYALRGRKHCKYRCF